GPHRAGPLGLQSIPWSSSAGISQVLASALARAVRFWRDRRAGLGPFPASRRDAGAAAAWRTGDNRRSAILVARASLAKNGREFQCGIGANGGTQRRLRCLLCRERRGARWPLVAGRQR